MKLYIFNALIILMLFAMNVNAQEIKLSDNSVLTMTEQWSIGATRAGLQTVSKKDKTVQCIQNLLEMNFKEENFDVKFVLVREWLANKARNSIIRVDEHSKNLLMEMSETGEATVITPITQRLVGEYNGWITTISTTVGTLSSFAVEDNKAAYVFIVVSTSNTDYNTQEALSSIVSKWKKGISTDEKLLEIMPAKRVEKNEKLMDGGEILALPGWNLHTVTEMLISKDAHSSEITSYMQPLLTGSVVSEDGSAMVRVARCWNVLTKDKSLHNPKTADKWWLEKIINEGTTEISEDIKKVTIAQHNALYMYGTSEGTNLDFYALKIEDAVYLFSLVSSDTATKDMRTKWINEFLSTWKAGKSSFEDLNALTIGEE